MGKLVRLLVAFTFVGSAFLIAPQPAAAATCYGTVTTSRTYLWERQFIYNIASGTAYLTARACYNGTKAYLYPGTGVGSGVNNRTGVVPQISRGSFVDSGGTLHVWTDMKFVYSCGSETSVAWVQLRTWYYKGGGYSHGHYKSDDGKCQASMKFP